MKEFFRILKDDTIFKSNVKFAGALALTVAVGGSVYGLNKRVGQLEWQLNGRVQAELEKDKEQVRPRRKAKFTPQGSLMYNNRTMIKMDDQDIECLARNIYHEARFEPYIGQIAVAQVTFNRVLDGKWGDSICKVVFARKQFSWTLKPKLRDKMPSGQNWRASMHVARMFQRGIRVYNLNDAKWYHADYVSPKWKHDYHRVTKLGRHIFYEKKSSDYQGPHVGQDYTRVAR